MTETMAQILDDVGFERWDEVDRVSLAVLVHNVASDGDNSAAITEASARVRKTFLRCWDMWLEGRD